MRFSQLGTPFLIGALFLAFSFVPYTAFADTIVSFDISEDTTWTKAGSPYLVQDWIMVDQDATLSIEPGVVVQFDSFAAMDIQGRLLAQGTASEPISFTSDSGGWYGIYFENPNASSILDHAVIQYAYRIKDFYSKDLSISNTSIEDGSYGIDAYGSHLSLDNFSAHNISHDAIDISYGSDVTLKNVTLKNVRSGVEVYVDSKADISNLFIDHVQSEAIAVYEGSNVSVASSTITDTRYAVEVFSDSSVDISNLMIDNVSGGEALSVSDNSIMILNDSLISNTHYDEVIGVYDSSRLTVRRTHISNGSGDGLQIYSGGDVDMQDSVISGFTYGAGIADYGSSHYPANSLSLMNNEIKNNSTGLSLYSNNSLYSISNNSIHDNTSNGLESYGIETVDVSNNFWGDPSGPYNDPDNLLGKGNAVYITSGSVITFAPWLSSWGTPPDPCAAPGACASSVLFLPGIEASRLYRPDYAGGTDKLWEPNGDGDARGLFMDESGASVRPDIYTKDVMDEAYGTFNIYKSFLDDLDAWKNAGTINDYRAAPYDWRVSLDDLLDYGREMPDGRLYYSGDLRATTTPYLFQELRRLAAGSKTGKVTLVAHSNGGLVAKALIARLGSEASTLIDDIIFVAVPQVGTPQAIGALLHGYEQGLPRDWLSIFLTPEIARTLAANMPSAYNLLPSAKYFTYIDSPVVTFDKSNFLADFRARYGSEIHDGVQLRNFITDARRLSSSSPSDLLYPSVGNAPLLSLAETFHSVADTWTPPTGISLYEVAGWGEDTLATVEYYEGKKTVCAVPSTSTCPYYTTTPTLMYAPKEVVEGDGTVLVPSALWTPMSSTTKKYWVNLKDYDSRIRLERKHADILEVPSLRTLVQNILTNSTSTTPLSFITTTQPSTDAAAENRLRFVLHSPLNLSATDNLGNMISSATSTIPGSRWKRYGEVQVLTVPRNTPITLRLDGVAAGSFTLDMQEIDGSNAIIASSTLSAIPSATSTRATMAFTDGTLHGASPLLVDYDGDGATDFSLQPEAGETTVFDLTPPEAVISFNQLSQRLQIIGIDNLSSTTVSTTATSSTITDEAGNTLQIIFKKFKQEKRELKLEIQALRYNGVSTIATAKTALQYEWSADKTGKLKELEEKATIGTLKVEGHYDAKKNVTKIEKKLKENDVKVEKKEILSGLVIIKLTTDKGKVGVNY